VVRASAVGPVAGGARAGAVGARRDPGEVPGDRTRRRGVHPGRRPAPVRAPLGGGLPYHRRGGRGARGR
jgi:hypothetical protein